mgnify:CR=1 FL=1
MISWSILDSYCMLGEAITNLAYHDLKCKYPIYKASAINYFSWDKSLLDTLLEAEGSELSPSDFLRMIKRREESINKVKKQL